MHGLSKHHLLQKRVLVIATVHVAFLTFQHDTHQNLAKLAYQHGYQDKTLCLNHHVVAS